MTRPAASLGVICLARKQRGVLDAQRVEVLRGKDVINCPRRALPDVDAATGLETLATEPSEQRRLIYLLILALEQDVGDAATRCAFMELFGRPQDIEHRVDRTLATSALHLSLQWSPPCMFAERVEWKNSSTGVALLPIGFRMLCGDTEKSHPKSLGLQRRKLPKRFRPVGK